MAVPDQTLLDALTAALRAQDGAAFSAAFTLAQRRGYTLELAPVLAAAMFGDWHHRHEEVVQTLQELRDPSAVDALFRAATQVLGFKYDDGAAFARNCTWARADIGTDHARDRLPAPGDRHDPARGHAPCRRRWPVVPSRRRGRGQLADAVLLVETELHLPVTR